MATSGRKPHTPGSMGTDGIKTITIDGPVNAENRGITNENEKKCSIRQNRDTILGRGTEEYVLSLREGTLEASTVNWIIPQPWDREWFFNRGGVFSPTQCEIADCKVALISETMQRPTDGSAKVASWGDWTDNDYEFVGAVGAEVDLSIDTTKKYFNSAEGDTTKSLFTNYASVGDALNVDVSAENWAAVFFVKTPGIYGVTENHLLCFSQVGQNGFCSIYSTNSGVLKIQTRSGGITGTVTTNTTLSTNSYYIIVIGTEDSSGNIFVRVNGTDDGTTRLVQDIEIDGTKNKTQVSLLTRETSTAYDRPWVGNLYEFYWLKSSTTDNSFLSEIEKIEGGIAWKYDALDLLPSDHEYKSAKPHGSPIKQGPNRYG